MITLDSTLSASREAGVVYSKQWAVDLVLDLAGYLPERRQVEQVALEPSAGDGAFLSAMVRRQARPPVDQGRRFSRSLALCFPFVHKIRSVNVCNKTQRELAKRPAILGRFQIGSLYLTAPSKTVQTNS
jgi:hypothetical protein